MKRRKRSNEDLSIRVGRKVREVRRALGLTLTDLSKRTRISVSQLSKIETEKIHPTIPALVTISSALGRPPTFFFMSEAEITRSLATVMPLTGPEGEALTALAALVQERSKGRIRLHVFPSVGLDRFSQLPDTLLAGAVDMVIEGLTFYQNYAEVILPASLPFCFLDVAHYEAFLSSSLFRERIVGALLNKGVRFLDQRWSWRRSPQVLVSKRPVFNPADLQGMKIRIYDSDIARSFWEGFGAKPVVVPWLETRRGLEDGTVDCLAVSAGLLSTTGFTKVAKYVTFLDVCDAMVTTVNIAIGEERYQLLPPDLQCILAETATQVGQEVTAMLARRSRDGLAECLSQHDAVAAHVNLAPFRQRAGQIIRDLERRGAWESGLFEAIQRVRAARRATPKGAPAPA